MRLIDADKLRKHERDVKDGNATWLMDVYLPEEIENAPTIEEIGHCKDCKYFEYDSVVNVDGIPLIVAHEICSKWGDGCKTKEDGYCFLFEQKESEEDVGWVVLSRKEKKNDRT